jgi:hydroxymethylpyrimidine/phosphomethylpyrimidine kinase
MTGHDQAGPAGVRLDIRRITLHGYAPARRDQFAAAIAARLTGAGAPPGAARQAAEAILARVDARVAPGRPGGGAERS